MPEVDLIDYALRYGGRCRDCADVDGVCPTDGTPCDPEIERAVLRKALRAWRYGTENGFTDNPFGDLLQEVRLQARKEALEEAARIADGWVEVFGAREVTHVSATKLATDAVKDVADGIRSRVGTAGSFETHAVLSQISCSVGTMKTSAGTDYYVVLKNGDREITPDCHSILGRTQYDCAHWQWFFGQAEEPDVLDFDTDGPLEMP